MPAPRRHFAEKHRVFPRSQHKLASYAQTGSSSCSDSLPVGFSAGAASARTAPGSTRFGLLEYFPALAPFGPAAYRGSGRPYPCGIVPYFTASSPTSLTSDGRTSRPPHAEGRVALRSRGLRLTRGFRGPVPLAASLRGVLPGLCVAPPLARLPAFHPGTRLDGLRPGQPPRVGAPLWEIAAP